MQLVHMQTQVTMGQTCTSGACACSKLQQSCSPAGETTLLRCPACSARPRGRAPAAGRLPQLRCTPGAPAEKDGCADEAVEGGRERASANSVSCNDTSDLKQMSTSALPRANVKSDAMEGGQKHASVYRVSCRALHCHFYIQGQLRALLAESTPVRPKVVWASACSASCSATRQDQVGKTVIQPGAQVGVLSFR